jgi:hypothetical protein
MTWRETEPYLAADYLDNELAELMEIIAIELPFERVRDGNVSGWVLRAEREKVITSSDRIHILAGLRAAREKRERDRGVLV